MQHLLFKGGNCWGTALCQEGLEPSPHLTGPVCVSPLCPLFPPADISPGGSAAKESACDAGGLGSVPGFSWEDPLEKGKAAHWFSGLENSMDRILHRVAKSQTRLSDFHSPFHGQRTEPTWPPSNPGPEGLAFSRKWSSRT